MSDARLTEWRTRLEPAVAMLEADGYRLRASAEGDGLRVEVEATEDACAECLVPRPLFEDIVRDLLACGDDLPITVVYPAGAGPEA